MPTAFAPGDLARLAPIEQELERTSPRLKFRDAALEARYEAEQQQHMRHHNRIAISIGLLLYDLFFLTELRVAPEIVVLSAVLRFALLTPAALLYILLDWRGKLGRCASPALVALAILPTIFAIIETFYTTSMAALPNLQAIPLLQFAALAWRMGIRQAALVTLLSCVVFSLGLPFAPYIPSPEIPSLVLTDIAIGTITMTLAMRLELRDRQVFLLSLQAAMRGDMLAAQNRALARLSNLDALTGLGNRRCFDAALAKAWEDGAAQAGAAQQTPVSLIMFDIDHFKAFNDTFGHQQGDDCLCIVARAAAQCVRAPTDTLARYGGEEFALILPGATLRDARAIAERLRDAVLGCAIPHLCAGPPGCITISLGVASLVPGAGTPAALVEAADRCLYAAKRQGRNRVETDDPPDISPVRAA